jgi:NADH-quinone oxidoreductase subunit G
MADDQVSLTIDDTEITVPKGTLLIRAAEQLQITIPRFCEHPLLEPIAACRQCLVEVEGQRKPMTACSTPAADDMVVRTHLTSEVAREGQEAQLEFLLINHPLDCPMCDKGGECPLQDQTMAHGPGESRFIEYKRRYIKPLPISPLIGLDRERCVLCARCTRFADEISGDPFIELFERGALEQVAIYEDEPYLSYFSGNVAQICPVGALTSTDYRFGARPFDLRAIDGICNQCSGGCNLRIDMRNGRIERQLARTNMATNEMWISDKCRHAYHYVDHPTRLLEPAARNDLGSVEPTTLVGAVRAAADRLAAALEAGGPGSVGVLTGGNLTDEDAYAVSRFARDVLGTDNVDFRRTVRTDEERPVLQAIAGAPGPTFEAVEHAGVVVLAGLDPEEEAPSLYLRLRKAVRRHGQRIVAIGPSLGSVGDIAWRWIRTAPGAEARILRALSGSGEAPREGSDLATVASALSEAVDAAAGGPGVVVLAGERLARSPGGLAAAVELATAGDGRAFAWIPRKAGARGAVDAGLLPGLLPGGRALGDPGAVAETWARVPGDAGLDTRGMLAAAADGQVRALYVIGADPVRDFEDTALARAALERVDTVIVQDLLTTDTTRYADVVLPAAAPQERVGSFTTWEGRRQAFPQVVPPAGLCMEDWDLLRQVSRMLGDDLGWETAMDVRREAAPLMAAGQSSHERLRRITSQAPPAVDGADDGHLVVEAVPSLLGRGSMLRGADALLATARPVEAWVCADDARSAGVSDGDTVVVAGPSGRIELPVRITENVAAGCIRLPQNSTDDPLGVLADPEADATGPVRVRLLARESASAGA